MTAPSQWRVQWKRAIAINAVLCKSANTAVFVCFCVAFAVLVLGCMYCARWAACPHRRAFRHPSPSAQCTRPSLVDTLPVISFEQIYRREEKVNNGVNLNRKPIYCKPNINRYTQRARKDFFAPKFTHPITHVFRFTTRLPLDNCFCHQLENFK